MNWPPQRDPTPLEQWEAFIKHWAQHHQVDMTPAARAALVRAASGRQLDPAALPPLELVTEFPPCQHFAKPIAPPPPPPAAPAAPQQETLF